MLNIQEEIEKQGFLREPTEDRIALYELMRKKYPKGKKEMQLKLAMEISDERIPNYVDLFNATK
jgi:hypothetical protein